MRRYARGWMVQGGAVGARESEALSEAHQGGLASGERLRVGGGGGGRYGSRCASGTAECIERLDGCAV